MNKAEVKKTSAVNSKISARTTHLNSSTPKAVAQPVAETQVDLCSSVMLKIDEQQWLTSWDYNCASGKTYVEWAIFTFNLM